MNKEVKYGNIYEFMIEFIYHNNAMILAACYKEILSCDDDNENEEGKLVLWPI